MNWELILSILTILAGLAWWLIKMFFKVKSLNTEIIMNRTTSNELGVRVKKDLEDEIKRIERESVERENRYSVSISRITTLMDQHSKADEEKFSHILSSLGEISSKIAVVVDRVGLIIDGKLGAK